jgi:probable lipoprotein NlpC
MKHGPFPGVSRPKAGFFLLNALWALFVCLPGLFAAAPLQGAYAQAAGDSASPEQKAQAAREARLKVIGAAGTYRGTPYRYAGIDRSGLDCSGLVYVSFRDALGVSTPRSTTGLYGWVEKISAGELQPGDLLFFKTDNSGQMSHVGIYTGEGRFIHSASAGPVTGVIVSAMDEKYWRRTYAAAGRALPAVSGSFDADPAAVGSGVPTAGVAAGAASAAGGVPAAGAASAAGAGGVPTAGAAGGAPARSQREPAPATGGAGQDASSGGRLLLGVAAAPSWNGFYADGDMLRGLAVHFALGAETRFLGKPVVFGLELRPEWDGGLGVFRMPVTFSWGPSNKLRFFIGPAFTIGNPALKTSGGERQYTGGTSWIGAAGISAAPLTVELPGGDLAVYGEFAWQSYFSAAGMERNWNADFAAGCRFSTGLRYTWRL